MTDELLIGYWDGDELFVRTVAERFLSEGDVVINKNWTIEQVLRLTQAEYNRPEPEEETSPNISFACRCGGGCYTPTEPARIAEPMVFGGANGLWSQVVR